MNIFWFKRDLRIHDNEAFYRCAQEGPFLPLYIIEPNLWVLPDVSCRHYNFLKECLEDLNEQLRKKGASLIIKNSEALVAFEDLHSRYGLRKIYVSQETWNYWTYMRDKKVERFCVQNMIDIKVYRQNGVIRRLKSRDVWAEEWRKFMSNPKFMIDDGQVKIMMPGCYPPSDEIPSCKDLKLNHDECVQRQIGGRKNGRELLLSFIEQRSVNYRKHISSPVHAVYSCSRLSPYIAFGCLSVREIYQFAFKKIKSMKNSKYELDEIVKMKTGNILFFIQRLAWHCHFIQKLEDCPELEFTNLHTSYDKLERENNKSYYKAWSEGKTGYPMIDACMRALIATGWINFRMRAMLVSFASYHLQLDWKLTSLHLARLFIDYEPGIHYSQFQMQSGTTGINSIRIYNPVKQGIEQDPTGEFIRKWLPELRSVEDKYIHYPWNSINKIIYPSPIINEAEGRKKGGKLVFDIRKQADFKEISQKIMLKHGSRGFNDRKVRIRKAKNDVSPT